MDISKQICLGVFFHHWNIGHYGYGDGFDMSVLKWEREMEELGGRVALVTGAGRGIGAATAKEFGRLGVSVLLAGRTAGDLDRVAGEIVAAGGKATTCVCDVSDYDDVVRAVETCQLKYGRLDILVNNAGIIDPIVRLGASDPDKWARVVDVNYKGVYFGHRAAIPVMEAQGSGVIINLSSGAAVNAFEGWSHYCSTKAAVLSLTKCAHLEYFDKGIRVLGLSPGMVATAMQDTIRDSGILSLGPIDPAQHISPEWVARAVAWVCSDAAGDIAGEDFSLRSDDARRRVGLID